jgi:hypothetical protein
MRPPYYSFIVKFLLFLALGSLAVMLLWNAAVAPAFGAGPLGYWQAMGLLVLSRVLFGNFGPHVPHLPRGWRRLSPEERMSLFRDRRSSAFAGQGGGHGWHGPRCPGQDDGRPGDQGGCP